MKTLVQDSFQTRTKFIDNSKLLLWGYNNDYKSAYEISKISDTNNLTYRAIHLTDSAIKYTDYHDTTYPSTKGMTCLDWEFGPAKRTLSDTLKIEFDILWEKMTSSGERGRINAILLHQYPDGGPDTGVVNQFDLKHPFGRPAYHFRLRNRLVSNNTGFIGYGGGNEKKGRLYRHDEYAGPDSLHWLPGAVPPSTENYYYNTYPEEINQKDFYGVVASKENWKHITWYIYPEKQQLYHRKSINSGKGELITSMDLPKDPPEDYPSFYHWFEKTEAFRMYFYGLGEDIYMANLKISFTGKTLTNYNKKKSINNNFKIKVYPNPFSDYLIINGNKKIKEIAIINSLGKTIKKLAPGQKKYVFKENLNKGFYYFKIITENNQVVKKVIAQ